MKNVKKIQPSGLKEIVGNPNLPERKPRKWNQPIETDWLVANNELSGIRSEQEIAFLHTVFCQTSLPYRNPGDAARIWKRQQGLAHLLITAGQIWRSESNDWLPVGLPFGPKPRLILAYLSTQAIKTQRRVIPVGDSLTGFVRQLGLPTTGPSIRMLKEQLARLAVTDFRLGYPEENEDVTRRANLITGIKLWFPKTQQRRVLWPNEVSLSPEYFESLLAHAVPLSEQAIAQLANNAMAFDVYTWLAQRLHRVPARRHHLVPWASLRDQFGQGYGRTRVFRRQFRATLKVACRAYPEARLTEGHRGLILHHSKPPIPSCTGMRNLTQLTYTHCG